MGFVPVKSDHGAVPPIEYLPAAAGDYKSGQLVRVEDGEVSALGAASTTTPPYLCMFEGHKEKGELLPVIWISHDYIYETTLDADMPAARIGAKLSVTEDGLAPASAAGTFEVTAADGAAAGDTIRGRFL